MFVYTKFFRNGNMQEFHRFMSPEDFLDTLEEKKI